MSRIKRKLKSRAGASITFALLLFLVCAVVGSVVLAAGSAAAGRFSRLREMDARYYSVTSAASLLREKLSGQTVTVTTVKTTETRTVTAYENGTAGTPAVTSDEQTADPVYSGEAPQMLIKAARFLSGDPAEADTGAMTLTHSVHSGVEADPLAVSVTRTLNTDGSIRMELKNTEGEPYTLILVFSCEQDRQTDRRTEEGAPSVNAESAEKYTVSQTVTLTETVRVTYRWELTDVRKAVTG